MVRPLVLVIAPGDLVQCVVEHPVQHHQAVRHTAAGTRQVHHQRASGDPDQPPGEHGGRHGGTLLADSACQAGDFVIQDGGGRLRRAVGRRDPRAARGDHHVRADGLLERVLDIGAIGNYVRSGHLKPPCGQPFRDQRSSAVGVDPGGRASGGDDHHCGSHDGAFSTVTLMSTFITTSIITTAITTTAITTAPCHLSEPTNLFFRRPYVPP